MAVYQTTSQQIGEMLIKTNGEPQAAHDALSDVMATIAIGQTH